jgi:Phosphodiester glycosidase
VLRPASRRSSQHSASPHGDADPASYEPGPHGPDGAPYRPDSPRYQPDAQQYQPDAPRYEPGPSPYGPKPAQDEPDGWPYRSDPGSYGPDGWPYRPDPGSYGPDTWPYRPDPGRYAPTPPPYRPDPYGQPPHEQAPYGQALPSEPPTYDFGQAPPPPDDDDEDRGRRSARRGRGRGAKGPGRVRRLLRRPWMRVIVALVAVLCCWLAFSVGQALTAPGGGSVSSKLAEWARDHYLGPVVTFGEWLTYNPPKVGGKPSFSLAVPKTAQVKYKHTKSFKPIIPAPLHTFAASPLSGEGQWRVLETVKGEPAIFGTFLRPSPVYTSYVAGIVSMDQRLVTFQLRPGAEDPGPGNWNAQSWIPPGTRTGLLATFNGGFKIDTSGGGFYLNGHTAGTLTDGAASVVYYRNGTIKIGVWGRDVRMTPEVVGVRQNLKLIVDHGQVPASVNQDVLGSWGATLGGGYYVWRSGLGITKDGRIIFVYGPALNVQELADLLQRAGAIEALQLDINPEWMSYDYYKADGHPSDPTPVMLLPDQQGSPYRYLSVYSRDFTAVYAR